MRQLGDTIEGSFMTGLVEGFSCGRQNKLVGLYHNVDSGAGLKTEDSSNTFSQQTTAKQ